MANREAILDQNPDVTNVVPQNPDALAAGIASVGAQAAEANEQSKLLVYGSQMHAQFKGLDAQFRMQYADTPNDPQGLKDLQAARQQISDNLGQNISSLYSRQWQDKTAELGAQSDATNEMWSVHQNYHNAINNTNTAMQNYLQLGNQDGKAYGASGQSDGAGVLNFLTARQQMESAVTPILGNDKAGAMLRNFNADYVKSFVAGVAETNPQQALSLINDPNVQAHFSTQDRDDMVQVIARVQKSQQLAQQLSVTKNNSQLGDVVNDPQADYYQKRAQIDQLDMAGSVTPAAAAQARRVIKSSADLDTQTDTPVMASLISRVYDLNASAATNGADYLRGVRDLQTEILQHQADGSLTAPDASKLNRQLTTLTSAKLASATQSVGNEFYEANQKFQALPPEFRGDATRQLFYAGDGKNFTAQQYGQAALGIIDNINAKRRSAAQQTIQQTSQSDAEMLKQIKATPADVTATAKKYNISEQEVINQLRQARLNKQGQKRPGKVTVSSSASDEGDMPARAPQPAPDSDLAPGENDSEAE